jgi:pyruvate dehydrogenase E2 component (dihydrolipoamide acetyltransferase)
MAIAITIPRLGWNMEEGMFGGWLKKSGEPIQANDALFALESDKAAQDIEALESGILWIGPHGPTAGDKLAVGTVIGYLLQPGEVPPVDRGPTEPPRAVPQRTVAVPSSGERIREPNATPAISPRARRLAAELGIEWTHMRGSGRTGRIRECDVRAAALRMPSK